MSALGHERTFCGASAMFALPPKAAFRSRDRQRPIEADPLSVLVDGGKLLGCLSERSSKGRAPLWSRVCF
jgi:hypothetical protein